MVLQPEQFKRFWRGRRAPGPAAWADICGTLFLVSFRGRVYGLTCQHAFQDFALEQLFITQEKQAQEGRASPTTFAPSAR